jgi:DNA repair protein RadD
MNKKFTLRPYQERAVQDCMAFFDRETGQKELAVLPTGAGKSLILSELAHKLDGRVIIFQPSKELLIQNFGKYTFYDTDASVYSASLDSREFDNVVFATIGTVKALGKTFKERGYKYVIIDEASFVNPKSTSMYSRFLADLEPKKILGLTASPIRLKQHSDWTTGLNYSMLSVQTNTDPKFFDDICHVTQIKEIMDNGFWSPLKYIQYDFDEGLLRYNTTGSEFTERSISEAVKKNNVNNTIYKNVKKLIAKGERNIIYADSVDNARRFEQVLDKTALIHANMPKKERTNAIAAFKRGDLLCLVNYGTLVYGLDVPELQHVHLGRPTNSMVLYYQMAGRLVRIHEDKEVAYVWDYCMNSIRFGQIEEFNYALDQSGRWQCYSGDKQLTGVRMDGSEDSPKKPNQDIVVKVDGVLTKNSQIWFGKHKGTPIKDLPPKYIKYMLREFDFKTQKMQEFKKVLRSLKVK